MTKKTASSASAKKPKSSDQAAAMTSLARRRWDARDISEQELKEFFSTEPDDVVFEALARMRKNFELASKLVNERVQRNNVEACSNPKCDVVFNDSVRWYSRDAVKDPETQALRNYFSCSPACFIVVKSMLKTGFRKFRPGDSHGANA